MKIRTSVAVDCFLPGRAKDLPAPLYVPHVLLVKLSAFLNHAVRLLKISV